MLSRARARLYNLTFRLLHGPLQMICLSLAFCIAVASALQAQQSADQQTQQSANVEHITPIDFELCDDMKARNVLQPDNQLICSRLRLVKFSYIDFDSKFHDDGEVVVMDAVAAYVLNIFDTLRRMRFPIAKARLLNNYDGNDDASMADNNTSAFNDRRITGGGSISLHAYGLAIDINPIQNPYIKKRNNGYIVSPPDGAAFTNRQARRDGMAEKIVDVFAENGFFVWGGSWIDPIDYQHFQTGQKMAERLALVTPTEAEHVFSLAVKSYRACREFRARQ